MSLDVLLAHEDSRQALAELCRMSIPFGALTMRYVALFRPGKRQMSHSRVASLLGELMPDMHREAITRAGREWNAPRDTWRAAFEKVLEARDLGKLTLPLKSHGYLYEVMVGLADKVEAQEERNTEASRRGRAHTAGAQAVGDVLFTPAIATPVVNVAPLTVPAPYTGPSRYAQQIRAENAARRLNRGGEISNDEGGIP